MDIQIIIVDPTTRKVSLGLSTKTITGISKLIQIVILSLMNNPGKDILDLAKGSGLPALVGSNIDVDNLSDTFSEIAQRVKKVEQEILADQVGSSDPDSEKLKELQIVDLQAGESPDEILLRVRIINREGRTTEVVV